MEKKISVSCECEGAGFIAVADNGGEGIEHIECGQHHPAFQDAPSVDELSPAPYGPPNEFSGSFPQFSSYA